MVLEGTQVNETALRPTDTERPVLVLVWLNTEEEMGWEQWKHLASVTDHPRMNLVRLVVMAEKNLEEMERHAHSMQLPSDTECRFLHVSTSQMERLFSPEILKTNSYTWVYLHKEPVFADGGRLIPPREWLDTLEW